MKPFAAAATALALAACAAVGPDYHGPRSDLPSDPKAAGDFAAGKAAAFTDRPVPGDWWRLYQDPALDALVAEALAANTDLRVAAANIELAGAQLREAETARLVQTSVNAAAAVERSPETANRTKAVYSLGPAVSYEVDLVGRIRRLTEAAHADADAAQAAYDLARVGVVANVVGAYADYCGAAYQRAAAARSLAVQQKSLAVTERLIDAGRGTALDRSRGEALVEQLRAAIPQFEAARENARVRLAVLAGRPPSGAPTPGDCAAPPTLARPLPVGDGAALIRRRPDIRQAERQLAAATARIGVATAELYPSVHLDGSLGLGGPLSQFASGSSFRFNIGPLISWTFPNTSVARARIAQAEAGEKGALARFDGAVLNALEEVETALNAYAHDLEENAALRAAQDRAEMAAGQAQRLYRAGRQDYLTALDAERTLASAQAALAASDVRLSRDQVALFLALGGGWQAG
jgi:NodT family efflux transporter outer membrane factor (OMF) lipoprotein